MIRIITDSGSDISQSEASKLGITVIPLKVRFNDIEYIDDVTITNEEFFNRLVESDELPKTSQLTPFDYTNVFDMIDKNDKANEILKELEPSPPVPTISNTSIS